MNNMQKNSWDIMFDHLRFDFGVRGIITYNSNATCTRVNIIGYPFVKNEAVNNNEVRK